VSLPQTGAPVPAAPAVHADQIGFIVLTAVMQGF
jgi:hypothetical protein